MKTLIPLQLGAAPDKNDPQPLVIYHGRNCPDGFAAALAAWLYYKGKAEFLGLEHGDISSVEELPALSGRAVYILDFAFSPELLRGIEARAAKLVDAIRPRVEAEDSEEDGMGGRIYDPEEDERLRRELAANCDRIEAIIESKRDRQAGGGHTETGGPQGSGERSPDRTA